jgi:hypothetical protein
VFDTIEELARGTLETGRTSRFTLDSEYIRQTARTSPTSDWLAALNARSAVFNERYGLGD